MNELTKPGLHFMLIEHDPWCPGAAGARVRGVAAMKKRERKPIPALLLTDATVDRFIAQAAAGRVLAVAFGGRAA